MAHITLKNVIDDGRALFHNHSPLHLINEYWRKITTQNATLNATSGITTGTLLVLPLQIVTNILSASCLQIAAGIVSLLPRLPFDLPDDISAIKPRYFYLSQWKDDAGSFSDPLHRLIYSMARVPDAISLFIHYGPFSKLTRNSSRLNSGCSCNNIVDGIARCQCKSNRR